MSVLQQDNVDKITISALLGSVINEERLMALLAESDAFISHLQDEMKEFDEGDFDGGVNNDLEK